jgi:AcrR family transcriptional regulator
MPASSSVTPESLLRHKKSQILSVAKARFLQSGVNKTTMRDLADDLGIAVSNLYLYFKNKQEIVIAIAQECRNEQELTDQVLLASELPAAEKLELLLMQRFQNIQTFRESSPKGKELMAYLLEQFPERVVEWQQSFETGILTILEAGNRQGEFCFTDLPQSARMIRLALGQFFLPAHIDLPIPLKEDDLRGLIRWLLAPWRLR